MLRPALLALPLALAAPAGAAELPTFAQRPASETTQDSPWKGWSVGVEAIAVGGRGIKGGFGGATHIAWNKTFENNLTLGLKASVGHLPAIAFAPAFGGVRPAGWNFAATSATIGYELGRVRPWASIGAAFLKPTQFGGARSLDAANSFFSEPGRTQGLVTYGAGVDFAVTNNLTIGVGVMGAARQ